MTWHTNTATGAIERDIKNVGLAARSKEQRFWKTIFGKCSCTETNSCFSGAKVRCAKVDVQIIF